MPFSKLMAAYSRQTGHELNTLRFVYDGTSISKRHTSESLGIENGETIFCFKLRHKNTQEKIIINIFSRMINKSIQFKIAKRTSFNKLMATYSRRTGHELNTLRFVYDGTSISKRHTSESLGIENGETIFCFKLRHKVIKK
ncbi:uncharacterized protein LOC113561154 [Rhopalosiphum maidis]|uniref:uncharacterized protein LOC113561154 n=1 Tax=Rhopalosiphum maidis TaxID=43146 RepID=UPI000EFEC2A3|nr:uncharacterized protein LOC113561154 [Rhopalosiphum maidis]